MPETDVVLRHRAVPGIDRLDVYRQAGGYGSLRRAVTERTPGEVVGVVKASGLRGRGGAGFPTALKWSFVPTDVFPRYVVVNDDESEPGTFKDHEITLRNPHQVIEGAAIAAYAVQAERVYVYCRGEFWQAADILRRAVAEAHAAGFLGPSVCGSGVAIEVEVTVGAGAYICGEETALLSSIEGDLGQPRLKPPYPAAVGLYGAPTVVNNVETLANLPAILERGAEWYRSLGTARSPGTKVFSLSGHVERPGNYELPLGTSFGELLNLGGGVWRGRRLKAILPAGASGAVIPADLAMDLDLDWESVKAVGSDLGSASVIVLDDTVDMAWVAERTIDFFAHESCGKCTPCREGTYWLRHLYRRLIDGRGDPSDPALIGAIVAQMDGTCFCPLGEFAQMVPRSTLDLFRADYARHTGDAERAA